MAVAAELQERQLSASARWVTAHNTRLTHPTNHGVAVRVAIASAYGYDLSMTVDQIRPGYRFNETCQETVPQALVCALEDTGFEDAIRNAISIGGDSDTVAAIAGPLAEAKFGIPKDIATAALSRLPPEMRAVLERLYASTEGVQRGEG